MSCGVKRAILLIVILGVLTSCQMKLESGEEKVGDEEAVIDSSSKTFAYVYRHRDTASSGNDREAYIWDVLEAALESTVPDYGAFEIEVVKEINQEREDYEIINNTGVVTVISDSLNQNNMDHLTRVNFPVLRNLLGYRVFLIDRVNKEQFAKIETVEDLKPYVFGLGIGWNDKWILEHAGLQVYEESDYETLFKDVSNGVFDVFSRGVNEVVGEMDTFSGTYSNLVIEDSLLLYYPLPRYFWFSTSAEGEKLRLRLEDGLKNINDDGRLEMIFNRYFEADLKQLNLKERKLIELENPLYTEKDRAIDEPYWFDPLK